MVLKLRRTISTLTRKVTGAIKLAGDWVIILTFIGTAYYRILSFQSSSMLCRFQGRDLQNRGKKVRLKKLFEFSREPGNSEL